MFLGRLNFNELGTIRGCFRFLYKIINEISLFEISERTWIDCEVFMISFLIMFCI